MASNQRVALVTGASTGIGQAAAVALVEAGYARGSQTAGVSKMRRFVPARMFDQQLRKLNKLSA